MYTALGVCAVTALSLSLAQDGAATLWRLIENEVGRVVRLTPAPCTEALVGR